MMMITIYYFLWTGSRAKRLQLDSDWSHIGWTAISFTWCQTRSEETGINCKLGSIANGGA
jgi:hypothetical protein